MEDGKYQLVTNKRTKSKNEEGILAILLGAKNVKFNVIKKEGK
jgi:hypothetical protein